jgi:hypothetical protein
MFSFETLLSLLKYPVPLKRYTDGTTLFNGVSYLKAVTITSFSVALIEFCGRLKLVKSICRLDVMEGSMGRTGWQSY